MAENNEVQISLGLDVEQFKQGLSESEQLMQQAVQRMNTLGGQPTEVQPPSVPGALPPPPVPPAPLPSSTHPQGGGGSGPSPIASAWEELEKIKQMAATAPDVAMANLQGLSGTGGLRSRVMKGAMADPDSAEEYQKLIGALRELSGTIKQETKSGTEGGPAGAILNFMRTSAIAQTLGMVGGNVMSGNMLGAAGAGIGGVLGLVGGPAGAMMGAQLGQMAAGTVGAFLGKTGEATNYAELTADIAARFGDFGQEQGLKIDEISKLNTRGYSQQETAQLFDALRQTRVIDQVDEEAKELVQSIQGLTRATGENTQAIVNQYAGYRQAGGRDTPENYMGQVISGAVAVGMRQNLSEYSEMLGSARMQLVYRGGMADENDGAMRTIQQSLVSLMGTNSRTSELLRDNPMMAQQMMSGFLATGSGRAYSYDSAAMQMAGVDRAHTTEGFISPEQQAKNAIARQQSVFQRVLGGGMDIMGFSSTAELQAAARANPNLVQDLFTDKNPNTQQAAALQDMLNVQLKAQYGRDPSGQERQMSLQMMQAYLQNGTLTPEMQSGGKSIQQLIKESTMTDAEKSREAEAEMKKAQMAFFDDFKKYTPELTKATADLYRWLSTQTPAIIKAIDTTGEFIKGLTDVLKPAIDLISKLIPGANPQPAGANQGGVAGFLADVNQNPIIQGLQSPAMQAAQALTNPTGAIGGAASNVADQIGKTLGFGVPDKDKNAAQQAISVAAQAAGTITNPIGAGVDAATRAVHGIFKDTPSAGVLATPGFNTFAFEPGDIVHASKTGFNQVGGGSGGGMPAINIEQHFHGGADSEAVRGAARSGVQSGIDEFLSGWESGRLDPRNKPRIVNRMY